METLATYKTVQSEANLPAGISEAVLQPHVNSASIELRKLFGASLYQTIVDEDDDMQRRIECVKGESLLAFAYALPFLNIDTSGKGIVSAKGWDSNRSELMSVEQTQELAALVRAQAMDLVTSYAPAIDDDTEDDDDLPIVQAGGMSFTAI